MVNKNTKGLVLVTGSDGLVGSRFVEISKCKNKFFTPKRVEFDITDSKAIKKIISSYDLKAFVNFAAFTDVGKAEKERGDKNGLCWQVNVEGVRSLTESIKPFAEKTHFIQISTDMVFSGSRDDPGPYSEDHPIEEYLEKLTWYGYTKAQGEHVVKEVLGDKASFVRILNPVRAKFGAKLDYIRKPLGLFDEGKLYPMFSDQQISITFIDELCDILDIMIQKNIRGVFHASSNNLTTPFNLISEVIKKTRGKTNVVRPIILRKFLENNGLPQYRYPQFGGLKVDKTRNALDYNFSSWEEIVNKLISQGLGKNLD